MQWNVNVHIEILITEIPLGILCTMDYWLNFSEQYSLRTFANRLPPAWLWYNDDTERRLWSFGKPRTLCSLSGTNARWSYRNCNLQSSDIWKVIVNFEFILRICYYWLQWKINEKTLMKYMAINYVIALIIVLPCNNLHCSWQLLYIRYSTLLLK